MNRQPYQMDQLEKIQNLRQQTRKNLEQCHNGIAERIHEMASFKQSTSTSRIISIAERGMAIYRAVQFGFRIGDVVSGLFGKRSRRRW